MNDFTARAQLPVRAPYRLDLTVDALRRLASNAVDVAASDGAYYRAFDDPEGASVVCVRAILPQDGSPYAQALAVEAAGAQPERAIGRAATMLAAGVDIADWYERAAAVPWLGRLARDLCGLKPPRYPSLWEACAHAIVFQQISIHAATAIMRRLVTTLGRRLAFRGIELYAFPLPGCLATASEQTLRSAGLSVSKIAYLRSVAAAIDAGELSTTQIESLDTATAAARLVAVRGIGPWSAAVVLLRGFGRLEVLPMKDSGVARLMRRLSGDPSIDIDALAERLGPSRGMLYYHLLLGGLRNLVPGSTD